MMRNWINLCEAMVVRDRVEGYRIAINPTRAEWNANFPRGAAGVLLTDGRIVVGDGPMLAHDVLLDMASVDQNLEWLRLQIGPDAGFAELWMSDEFCDTEPTKEEIDAEVSRRYGAGLAEIEAKLHATFSRFMMSPRVKAVVLDPYQEGMLPGDEEFRASCWKHDLNEGATDNYLYHGTSIASLIQMIHEDRLCSGAHFGLSYISLSRDVEVAKKFATAKSCSVLEIWMNDRAPAEMSGDPDDEELKRLIPLAYAEHYYHGSWAKSGGGAILVFDRDSLRQRYKIVPHHDGGREARTEKWEMEERILRDVKPLRPMIKKIILCGPFGQIARATLTGELGSPPQPQYADAVSFIRSMG